MPEAVQYLMLAAPNTHFVILAQAILYRGAGLDVVWPQFLALASGKSPDFIVYWNPLKMVVVFFSLAFIGPGKFSIDKD